MAENDGQLITQALVICGTCDLAYRVHAGRTNCPACGGEALAIVMDLAEEPAQEEEPATTTDGSSAALGKESESPPEPAPREHSPAAATSSLPSSEAVSAAGEPPEDE